MREIYLVNFQLWFVCKFICRCMSVYVLVLSLSFSLPKFYMYIFIIIFNNDRGVLRMIACVYIIKPSLDLGAR